MPVKLYGSAYNEAKACLELIKEMVNETNLINYREKMKRIQYFADTALRELNQSEEIKEGY